MIHYWPERGLSSKAMDLVEFDMASIRLLTHGVEPNVWLVSTDQYEKDGRLLRDSTSPRLLAYSPETKIVYANDGCNTCTHPMSPEIPQIRPEFLAELKKII
jgi:hypothetical protein